ncbi:hypothetical protein GCM10022254_62320 [Actinomadura meridiana]|uniref:Uncharacterized protein n=1 Tax=Actinomadura meridiana TaxID=559626 RepID=A0ABP8CJ14_9ACTN
MPPDPYRPWRLAIFVVVLCVTAVYVVFVALSFLASLMSV